MKQPEHVTVVYTIKDRAAFDEEWKRIHGMFRRSADEPKYCVTAISNDHELNRLNLIEEAMDKYPDRDTALDAIGHIIACAELPQWNWEKFERGGYDR